MNEVIFETSIFGNAWVVTYWKLIGYFGSTLFFSRWIVQAYASTILKKSHLPILFWYMSLCGSLCLLSYFIWGKNDSVGILANLFPPLLAIYNLTIIYKHGGKGSVKIEQ